MLSRPPQADEREESGELFWSCHASNAVSFRTAPHDQAGLSPMPNGSPSPGSWLSTLGCGISPETARSNPSSQRLDLRALGYELVAFMSLCVSQTDPAILAVPGVVAVRSTTRRRQHPHAGRREKHPRPAPDHQVDPRRRRRRRQQHRHRPGRGHPMLAARPVPRRRRLLAQARTIPARTAGALSIASANGATAIISFSIASRPGGLANGQR
jgi:hypothetical protein